LYGNISDMGKLLPNRLRVLRAEKRITQLALAKKAGINVATVSFFENGHRAPTPDEQKKLARALKVDVTEVFPAAATEAIAS
jgi:transcriptional regulator with XRE-family HTH domain